MQNNDNLNAAIRNLKEDFEKKYGFTLFNIKSKKLKRENEILIIGECLTLKQLNLLKRLVLTEFTDAKVHYDIKVLTNNSISNRTLWWGKAERSLVNITSDYFGKSLSTQITPKDNYFKIILKKERKSLVLLDDLTTGWVLNKDIYIFKKDFSGRWLNIKTPEKGKTVIVDSISPLFDEALKYIDIVTYLRGGKSLSGIDCSALVQLLFKRAFDLTLPRHTLDQMKCGVRIPRNNILSGDLVFAKLNGSNIMHTGCAFFDKGKMIIHACLREKLVICEDIDTFFKYYSFAGARRIVKRVA